MPSFKNLVRLRALPLAAAGLATLLLAVGCGHSPGLRDQSESAHASSKTESKLQDDTLIYALRPRLQDQRISFDVELSFRGSATGETKLLAPPRSILKDFHVVSPDARSVMPPSPALPAGNALTVKHPPKARVVIRYQIFAERSERSDTLLMVGSRKSIRFHANAESYFFSGSAFFILPESDQKKPLPLMIRWDDVPSGWSLANSYGVNERVQMMTTSLSELQDAFFIGGTVDIRRTVVNRKTVYVAIRGDRSPSGTESMHQNTARLIRAEVEFWNDPKPSFLLLPMIQVSERCCFLQTGSHLRTLSVFYSRNQGEEVFAPEHFADALFQYFVPDRFRFRDKHQNLDWLTSGVFRYFSSLLALRAGVSTLDDYAWHYNRIIADYYTSVVRKGSNRALFSSDPDDELKIFFSWMGTLLANNWDYEIREASQGRSTLESFIQSVRKDLESRSAFLSARDLNVLSLPFLSRGISGDLRKYVELGGLIPPEPKALGPCADLKTEVMPSYQLGFDLKVSKLLGQIAGVDAKGAPYAQGVRNGQKLVSWSFTRNPDPKQSVVQLAVVDGGQEKEISYRPAHEDIMVPQYRVDSTRLSADPATCLSWLTH